MAYAGVHAREQTLHENRGSAYCFAPCSLGLHGCGSGGVFDPAPGAPYVEAMVQETLKH